MKALKVKKLSNTISTFWNFIEVFTLISLFDNTEACMNSLITQIDIILLISLSVNVNKEGNYHETNISYL